MNNEGEKTIVSPITKLRRFTDEALDENVQAALAAYSEHPDVESIVVFPDIHYCAEKALPVGVSMLSRNSFFPLVTGKDMGCGVAYLRVEMKDVIKPFDKAKHYRAFDRESLTMTDEGLGGGNHFLALEESDEHLYIIVHTGSRNLGLYMYQQNLSITDDSGAAPIEAATEEYIDEYSRIIAYASSRRETFLLKTLEFLKKNGYVEKPADGEIADSVHNHLEFTAEGVIHRKGSTSLVGTREVVIPISMSRGSLIVKANVWDSRNEYALRSCSHGAGRALSRTDTLKHWHSLKKSERELYKAKFPELLDKSGEIASGYLQEMDFAYKPSDSILQSQPYLINVAETRPIVTVKFTGI